MTTITLYYNPQYLPDVDGLDPEQSVYEWLREVRKAATSTPVTIEDEIDDRNLHEFWTWTSNRIDAWTQDELNAEIDRLTERGDWQVFSLNFAPENPARARY